MVMHLPRKFRCLMFCRSECGKTHLLKNLIIDKLYFDTINLIGPTAFQYEDVSSVNGDPDIEFIRDVSVLQSPDKYSKNQQKLMTFDDVRAKQLVFNEFFCRGRNSSCKLVIFPLDSRKVRKICDLFILFEQRSNVLNGIYNEFCDDREITCNNFAHIYNDAWKGT